MRICKILAVIKIYLRLGSGCTLCTADSSTIRHKDYNLFFKNTSEYGQYVFKCYMTVQRVRELRCIHSNMHNMAWEHIVLDKKNNKKHIF